MRTPRSRRWLGSSGTCAQCGGTDAIEIRLRLSDDSEVDFHSCHRCEHRWWDADGETIDLTTVLDLARRP
jgi:DNA-directed RNA polymerase subunit M/transcription elongation factor TFIIS